MDGIMFYINTVHLLTRVDRLELDKQRYMITKFEEKIDDLDYEIIEIEKPVPKSDITGKDEDKYILTNKKEKVRLVFNVSNSAGMFKSFTTKEEAMTYAKRINDRVIKALEE